jgi:hypothetical protein
MYMHAGNAQPEWFSFQRMRCDLVVAAMSQHIECSGFKV